MATQEMTDETTTARPRSWAHQIEAFRFAVEKSAAMLAMDMGTGKSKVAVDLLAAWDARNVLILAPLSVLSVWRREFATHDPRGVEPVILDRGAGDWKRKRAAEAIAAGRPVVVNYESAWRDPLGSLLVKTFWDAAVCDESHRIKSPQGKASKLAARVGIVSKRRLCLTGTPMPHSPLDLYAQFRFLDRSVFGTSYTAFRARYAVTNPMFASQVVRWINEVELQDKYHSLAFRVRARDVLSLPEVVHQTREVSLSPKARVVYNELQREMVARIDSGEITAANALVKLLRLQQITSGFVAADDSEPVELCHAKKYALQEIIEDIDPSEPVVVFCRFRRDLEVVRDLAERLGRRYDEVSGTRRDLTATAEMRPGCQVLGVQIQSGGVGIDLTRARYAVYYSLGFSLGDYEQSLARVHRPGQTRTTFYYHLVATNTVDEAVYGALRKRRDVVTAVLDGIKLGGTKA